MTSVAVGVIGFITAYRLAAWARSTVVAGRVDARASTARRRVRFRRLESALALTGTGLSVRDGVACWLGSTVALGMLASVLATSLIVPAIVSGLVGGPIALRYGRRRHVRQAERALPEVVERIAGLLRSGGTVQSAVQECAASDTALAGDFGLVRRRVSLGASLGDALAAWAASRPGPEPAVVAGALVTAGELGGPSADALERLAQSLRATTAVRAEARSLSTQARLSAWIVGAGPLVYLAVSAAIAPGSLDVLVGHPVGRVCLVVGLALLALAAVVLRRMLGDER